MHAGTLRKGGLFQAKFFGLLLALATVFAIFIAVGVSPERRLSITLSADRGGALQVYFDRGAGFSEADSVSIDFDPGSNTQSIQMPDGVVNSLRLDPDPAVQLRLLKVEIETPAKGHAHELSLKALKPLSEIAVFEPESTGVLVQTEPQAKDAQLLLPVKDDIRLVAGSENIGRMGHVGQVLLLLALVGWVVVRLARTTTGVPVPPLLLGAWLLVGAMALTSTTTGSIHPDEADHVAAARYYLSHWKPPAVDAPEIVETYSVWGLSYLNELDVVYLVAAKATHFWAGFGLDETIALRLFNVILLAVLLVVAWVRADVWEGAAVLLLTPQIWYVFSYFNADAFPFFLSLLVAMLFAGPDSPVSRFVEGKPASRIALCLFVLALGLLLISKRNFPPVVLVVGLSLAVRHLGLSYWGVLMAAMGAALLLFRLVAGEELIHIFPNTVGWISPVGLGLLGLFAILLIRRAVLQQAIRPRLYRIGALFALALLVALPRVIADVAVNGDPEQKSSRMKIAAENYAGADFKPSVIGKNVSASYPGIKLAAKGVKIAEVVGQPYSWASQSWRSMLGVYGYMNVFAPVAVYWLLSAGLLVLCINLAAWARRRSDAQIGLFVTGAGIFLVVISSLFHSWVNAFQPQGRYLLPSFVIVAMYLLSQPGLLKSRWAPYAVALCFVVSVISFLGTALPSLAGR